MIGTRDGIAIPQTLNEWCDPRRTALLVYDMQIGICRQVADAAAIVERTAIVLDAARSAGMRVAFTRHLSLPRAWMGMTQLRMAMNWQRSSDPDAVQPRFARDAAAASIVAELTPRRDEAVFDKITMSAFDSTALGLALRDCGVHAVAIAGIALEIGIEPTVRQAADNGFAALVIEDACGFGNREARDRAMATLRYVGDAVVTDVAAFSASLARSDRRVSG